MGTMSMGFYYDEGKRVGYDISFPHYRGGGRTLLPFVSSKDKARIVREIKQLGHSSDDIEILRVGI